MKKKRFLKMMTERYEFDYGECSLGNGWAQLDSSQDASYFGTWANPQKLEIFSYVEGDCCRTTCDNAKEFVSEIHAFVDFANSVDTDGFRGIDCGCGDTRVKQLFIEIGLGDLVH